jgi:hypothetical protein
MRWPVKRRCRIETAPTLRTIAALTILGITGTAHGGPPFVTDDPEPVDYQHWEFYVASQDAKFGGDWSGT